MHIFTEVSVITIRVQFLKALCSYASGISIPR